MAKWSAHTVGVELRIGAALADVASLRLVEGLNRVTHAVAEVASTVPLDPQALKGSDGLVELHINGSPVRTMSLVVGKVAFLGESMSSFRFTVDLYSRFWLLRHTRDLRKYRNMSAKDIISKVLSENGVKHRWHIKREPPVRKYCVQYRESHYDFVNRLLEFEGIYARTEADGSLSLEDTSPRVPAVDGQPMFPLRDHAGALEAGEVGVYSWGWGARVGTGKATVNDYNWKKPTVDLLKSKAAGLDSELEWYDYPTGYRKPEQGVELAQMRLEALRARTRFAEGAGNVPFFMPGKKVIIEDEEVLLLDVEHSYRNPAFFETDSADDDGEQVPLYENSFEAIPLNVPFRPPVETPQPSIDGSHTAMVVGPPGEEIHTDRFGRFRAQFHWDREATGTDEDSRWLRKLQEGATSINLARVGWEVSVSYIDGDPDRPVGLARDINGVMVPAYSQPANKTVMTIKTPTYPGKDGYNEIKLDDTAGAQCFDWRAEKDLVNRVNNNKTETVGNDETHQIDAQFKRYVRRDQTVDIGGDYNLTVKGDYIVAVEGDRTVNIGGDQTIKVGASFQVGVEGDQFENVGSNRMTKLDEGMVSRAATKNLQRTCGGAHLAVTKDNLNVAGQYLHMEDVGGSKMTIADDSIAQSGGKYMMLTVGGGVFKLAGESAGYNAKDTKVTVGALAQFDGKEKVELSGKEVLLTADTSLSLTSKNLDITLMPSKTTMEGNLRLEAKQKITVKGLKINITKA